MSVRSSRGLLLLVALGGLLLAGYLVTPIMDSDQAIHGLQSRHFLLGEFAVFQWGLAYMGTFQSFLTAGAFALFGASRLVLNVIPLVLSLLFILVTYRLGREMGGERLGLIAASLVALAPPYLAVHGAWARHGYVDTLLLGSLMLLLAVRLARGPHEKARESRLFAVLGLVAGLAWWTNFLSLSYFLAVAAFLLLHDWRCLLRKAIWLALAFFLLGSAPFWFWNLLHGFESFSIFRGGDLGQAPLHFQRMIVEGLPVIIGVRGSRSSTNLIPVVPEAVMVIYAAALVWLVWRQLSRAWTNQKAEPGPTLLLLFLGSSALLVSLSRFGAAITVEGTMRYLLPLYSALPLLYALFLVHLRAVSRSLFVALLILPLSLHLYGNLARYTLVRGEVPHFRLARAQDEELFRFLKARGLTRVYAPDYWQAPRLTFDAREEIIFAQPFRDRYPPYTRLLDAAPRVAYLLSAGRSGLFEASLKGIGANFEQTRVGPYAIFHQFRPPRGVEALRSLPRSGWHATASSTRHPPALAFDRDIDTSWFSGEALRPDLFFQVDLGQPTHVGKVVLLPPQPSVGSPPGYRIELSLDGQRWEETAAVGEAPWSLDWAGGQPRMEPEGRVAVTFDPREARYVRIHQTGTDTRRWWAIGELFVYGPDSSGPARPAGQVKEHLDRGGAHEAAGKVEEAIREYWRAARLDPHLEVAHARLGSLYERTGVPLEGAAPPGLRAVAFERLGLWAKAAREYEKEIAGTAHDPHHTHLWRRLVRAYREAGAQGEAGEDERARLVEERLAREFSPAVLAAANFDGQVQLLGYRVEPGSLYPGRTFHLTFYWQSLRRMKRDYAFFVHFVREGRVAFQHDHFPFGGAYPTSQWQEGEVVREPLELVTPDIEAGTYEIVLGVWDPKTSRRLAVKHTPLAHRKDRVVAGAITVGRRS